MIPGRPAASHFTGSSRSFLCSRWIMPACARAGIGSCEGLRRACRDGGVEGACRRGVVSDASWRPERSDLKRSRHVSPRTFASRTAARRVSSMCARQCAGKQRRATSEGQHVLLVPCAPTSSIMHCSSSATSAPSACASSSSCRRRFIPGFDFQIWQVNPPLRACCTAAQWRAGAQRPEGVQQTMIEQMTVQVMSGSCPGCKLVANYSVPSGQ